MKRWLTISNAAEYMSYSKYKIRQMINEGLIPVTRIGTDGRNGNVRIDMHDLDRMMESHKINPTKILQERRFLLK